MALNSTMMNRPWYLYLFTRFEVRFYDSQIGESSAARASTFDDTRWWENDDGDEFGMFDEGKRAS